MPAGLNHGLNRFKPDGGLNLPTLIVTFFCSVPKLNGARKVRFMLPGLITFELEWRWGRAALPNIHVLHNATFHSLSSYRLNPTYTVCGQVWSSPSRCGQYPL